VNTIVIKVMSSRTRQVTSTFKDTLQKNITEVAMPFGVGGLVNSSVFNLAA
jgi:hypothetical protein